MKSVFAVTKAVCLSLVLSSCAASGGYYLLSLASAGAYGGYWWLTRPTVEKAIDDAQIVNRPVKGKLGTSLVDTHHGAIMTESYSLKTKEVCLVHHADDNTYRYQLGLIKDKASAGTPLAYHKVHTSTIVDQNSRTQAYETKEKTEYKNSSGQTFATAERPVTKYETVTSYTMRVCFPDVQLVQDDDFYMVVAMDTSSNESLDDNSGYAAWHVVR